MCIVMAISPPPLLSVEMTFVYLYVHSGNYYYLVYAMVASIVTKPPPPPTQIKFESVWLYVSLLNFVAFSRVFFKKTCTCVTRFLKSQTRD